MNVKELIAKRKQKAQEMFETIDEREDLYDAICWAKNVLTEKEGPGHFINLIAEKDQSFRCAFAKPQWPADHCGSAKWEAGEAIVIAVCEYLCGC